MRFMENLYVYIWENTRENNCNTYFLDGDTPTLIDPGHLHLLPQLEIRMNDDGLSLKQARLVLATHPHPDHCEGMAFFNREPTRLAMHSRAEEFLRDLSPQWERMTGKKIPLLSMDFHLREGRLDLGDKTLEVLEAPGHAPGSVCFYWKENRALFTGDVVFNQSVGRVDLPGGDPSALGRTIDRLTTLEVDLLLPGHGPLLQGKGAVKENFRFVRSFMA